jgi:Superoxide dismutase
MIHELSNLPYADNALEPIISKNTIGFHHGKHHKTYVDNLNKLIAGTEYENMSLEEIIVKSNGASFNNAAQVWNHSFYFASFKADAKEGAPLGALADAINKKFGSFENFKKEFSDAAVTLFGAGWAWLVKDSEGNLSIVKESNAGNPLTQKLTPILTFDVWEHAYYLDYQNRRADHIAALWSIIDWEVVSKRY